MKVEVTSPLGPSTIDRAIDATFGAVVRFEISEGPDVMATTVSVFDAEGAVLQHGRIASAIAPPFGGASVWHVTLVAPDSSPVVCDDLDNDGNGAVDEDECAE